MKTEAEIREKIKQMVNDPEALEYYLSYGPFINALYWVLDEKADQH
jgi:hypothetical protein